MVNEDIEQAAASIAGALGQSFWALLSDELAAQLAGLEDVITRARAAQGLAARELDGRDWAREQAATSMSTWLRDHLRITVAAGHRLVGFGTQLDTRPQVRAAVDAGQVNVEQAAAIRDMIDDLPTSLGTVLIDRCEEALIGFAAVHEPTTLRRLGERILAHVPPDLADAELARKLERDEAAAAQARAFTIGRGVHGVHRVFGRLDTESAAVLRAAIDPLCGPIPGTSGERDLRTAGQCRADALTDVCRLALATTKLPDNGGDRPQINVTVNFDALTRQLSMGTPATFARRRPATSSGETSVLNGVLLCDHHHRVIHRPDGW